MSARGTLTWLAITAPLAAAVLVLAPRAPSPPEPVNTTQMLDASVSIRTITNVHTDQFGDSVWASNTGSGFLVSTENCEVWTNHHVIEDAAQVEVFPRGWERATGIPTEVVNSTPRADLAILRMAHCEGLTAARLGDSAAVRAGDEAYAVGNPLGRNPGSVSRGIISHTRRYLGGSTPYLQTDAAINPGNSGGALFDRRGRVIGITTAIATPGKGSVGIGYAVPVDHAREVVAQLRRGPPSWGDAGIGEMLSELSPEEAEIFQVPHGRAAVILTETPEKGPAAGKLRARDVVYAIDDEPVTGVDQAARMLAGRDAGERVDLSVMRGGAPVTVALTLTEGWKPTEAPAAESYQGHLGMTLEMWDRNAGEGGSSFEHPVITRVQSLGPAHRAHIASSQHAGYRQGPFLGRYQLDVKTVTGAVYRGVYHPVDDVDTLERLAAAAYARRDALLLEIELWARRDPRDLGAALERIGKAYYRVVPARPGREDIGPAVPLMETRSEPPLPRHDQHPVSASL